MLSGTNTYQGGTTVTKGLINFASASNFGAPSAQPSIRSNGGGLQWATGTSTDISGDVKAIGANGATFDTNNNNVSFATALSGTGSVTKAGLGVLTFTKDNTYTGGTVVTGGLINFKDAGAFGNPGSQLDHAERRRPATGHGHDHRHFRGPEADRRQPARHSIRTETP